MELLTATQMRAIEQAAIDSAEVTGLELMERAGQGVVDAIFQKWPELAPGEATAEYLKNNEEQTHRAVVLCGPGNNGGDGFVVARLLHARGWQIEVYLYGTAEQLPPDARANYEQWRELGPVSRLVPGVLNAAVDRSFECAGARTVFIDALFGIGLTRAFSSDLLKICGEWSDACYEYGVAIDIPSGLCADSGKPVGGNWFFSKLVVTFQSPKAGLYLHDTTHDVETVNVVDLELEAFGETAMRLFDVSDLELDTHGGFQGALNKSLLAHKYSHGHALVLSGTQGSTGAARLAARAALRVGAGLVTVSAPKDALPEIAAQITSLMVKPFETLAEFKSRLDDPRFNAVCVGPGLGQARAKEFVEAVTGHENRPAVVLDADALSAFEGTPDELFARLHEKCVMTPHAGEFRRLFPDIAARLDDTSGAGAAYSKADATKEAARRAGCVVVFKGAATVIADSRGRCTVSAALLERKAPWLATAGSGDVLAGLILGLLARGFAPMSAAEHATWLHVECARSFGPGLIAEDLPEELPKVLRQLFEG